jgi:hypothetical protein
VALRAGIRAASAVHVTRSRAVIASHFSTTVALYNNRHLPSQSTFSPYNLTPIDTPRRYALSKQVYYRRDEALNELAQLMEDQFRFDTSRLVDLEERVLLDCPAVQVIGNVGVLLDCWTARRCR